MRQKDILIIDDDRTTAHLIQALLESNGFLASSVLNGTQALQTACERRPDLIILDRSMPDIDGHEVLKQILNTPEVQNIPVIMLTGHNEIHDVSESLKLGAKDYIIKPFDHDNLITRLREVLEKEEPDSLS